MKKLISLLAISIFVGSLSACTSHKAAENEGEEVPVEAQAEAPADGSAPTEQAADANAEQKPADAVADNKPAEQAPAAAAQPEQKVAENNPPPAVDPGTQPKQEITPAQETPQAPAPVAETAPPPPAMAEAPIAPIEPGPVAEVAPAKSSLQKIKTAPFKKSGMLLNAVYVARKGDDLKSIAKMIYGEDKSKVLAKANPSLKKSVHVGDKVYYNSPQRPNDDQKMLTWYEDQGIAPEIYIAKKGDNVKTLAKEFIGDKNSWKELYATNAFDSKGALSEGTEVRYWKSPASILPTAAMGSADMMAKGDTVKAPSAGDMPPPDMDKKKDVAAANAPTPPIEAASPNANMPPPPPTPSAQANVAPPTPPGVPPPPTPEQVAPKNDLPPPPPPPPVAKKKEHKKEDAKDNGDDDMIYMLGGLVVIAAGGAGLIVARRKKAKAKEMAEAFNDTQVGT